MPNPKPSASREASTAAERSFEEWWEARWPYSLDRQVHKLKGDMARIGWHARDGEIAALREALVMVARGSQLALDIPKWRLNEEVCDAIRAVIPFWSTPKCADAPGGELHGSQPEAVTEEE